MSQATKIPHGWKLVPLEPTELMETHGFESAPHWAFTPREEWEAYETLSGCQQAAYRARACYKAMLAAAPQPPDVRPNTVMAKPMPVNALWDAIGVYCEAVIDDELAVCGIGEKVDPRLRIGAAKRLIDLIGDRTDHDAPAQPANRLHKDAFLSQEVKGGTA